MPVMVSIGASLASLTEVAVASAQPVRVHTGRDSARSLNPPQVPRFHAGLVSSATDTVPYQEGDFVRVTQSIGGMTVNRFTGILDEPRRTITQGRYWYSVSALGLSSRLTTTPIYTAVHEMITVEDACEVVLQAAGLSASDYDIDSTGLTAQMSYWWVWGETAWNALARLMQTQGPPATFYENGSGVIVVLGTGWPSADADPAIEVGGPGLTLAGYAQQEQPTEDVVNDVAVDAVNYVEGATEVIWARASNVNIPANDTVRVEARTREAFVDPVAPVSGTDFTIVSGAVTVTLENTLARGTTIVIEAGNADAEISALQLRASPLDVAGIETEISDETDTDTAASIAVYGRREWRGRPYGGISILGAASLAQAVPIAYRDGIVSQRARVYVGAADEDTAQGIDDLAAISLEVGGVEFDGRAREVGHEWINGQHYIDIVVDQDGGLIAQGIDPFILGTSTLDGGDVLWL